MAKQYIVLGKTTNDVWDNFDVLFWYPISSGMKARSSSSAWDGASTAENNAILAGTVLEEAQAIQFPVGLSEANAAAVEAYLLQMWTNRNAQINGVGPGQYAGIYEDPSAGGVQQGTP